MITLFDSEEESREKSLANIPINFGSQGQIFYSELDIHLEVMVTNDKFNSTGIISQ